MFDDPNKELKQLEEKLLAEEADQNDWFEKELEEAKSLLGETDNKKRKAAGAQNPQVRNFANNYGKDHADPEKKEEKPKKKGIKGLAIVAVVETLAIAGLVAYWLMFLL